jgi:hypothetical protein
MKGPGEGHSTLTASRFGYAARRVTSSAGVSSVPVSAGTYCTTTGTGATASSTAARWSSTAAAGGRPKCGGSRLIAPAPRSA